MWVLSFSAFILPKSKKTQKLKTCRASMQSFVILGSLLQWHFVFLLFSNLKLPNNNHVCSSFQGLWCNLWSIIKRFPILQNYFSCQSKIFVKNKLFDIDFRYIKAFDGCCNLWSIIKSFSTFQMFFNTLNWFFFWK